MEPLDVIHTVFPNEGRAIAGDNICFSARPFHFSPLRQLLPDSSLYFTPDEFVDGLVSMVVISICVAISIFFAKEVWNALDSKFSAISPDHKKMYVVANMSKAALLGILALSPRYWVGSYNCFILDEFQAIETKRCGIIYMVTDLVALFIVAKLPRSTVFHHITTSSVIILVCAMNLQVKGWNGLLGVSKMGVLYGLFSSAAFPVNMFLALRVVYPDAKWLKWFAKFSLLSYIICCTFNWSIHAVWLARVIYDWRNLSIFPFLYMCAIYFLVTDDIVLMKWLWYYKRNDRNENTTRIKDTSIVDNYVTSKVNTGKY